MYEDLREWLDIIKKYDVVEVIEGADWDEEIGCISELILHNIDRPPALLFDNIKGYPQGQRILVGALASVRRLAITLGISLEKEISEGELIKRCRRRLSEIKPLDPVFVNDGPVMKNVQEQQNVDLNILPAPKWYKGDGGRYLGTGSVTITTDPDSGWVNLGTYRVMIHDNRTLGFYISPGKHGRIHREKWWSKGKPCPVCISFGHDPLFFLFGFSKIPFGVSELQYIGGIKENPVEVLKGELTGLPYPASAEIVIEGFSYPNETLPEGPFGEYTGYYASGTQDTPYVRVERLMYRDNPIILASPRGRPPSDTTTSEMILSSATIWDAMEKAGVPEVKGVNSFKSAPGFFTVVAISPQYPGHAMQAGMIASQCAGSAYMGRFVVVTDDDVNIYDVNDVLWAMGTRCDPERDIHIFNRCWSGPLDPALGPKGEGLNSRVIIDATRPYEWRESFPHVVTSSKQIQKHVSVKWNELLERLNITYNT